MKFDCVIMNPPYSRTLHMKIMEMAIKQLSLIGKLINLSPARWLRDPIARLVENSAFKRYEHSIGDYLKSLELLPISLTDKGFGIAVFSELAIYECDNYGGLSLEGLVDKRPGFDNIIIPLLSGRFQNIASVAKVSTGETGPWTVKISLIHGHSNNPDLFDIISSSESIAYDPPPARSTYVEFQSELERNNFRNSLLTKFYRYVNYLYKTNQHINLKLLPWLAGKTNPRTGLKGYQSEWTSEDLCELFHCPVSMLDIDF